MAKDNKGEVVLTKSSSLSFVDVPVYDSNHQQLELSRVSSFCRCGQSSSKPYCDETHSKIGFVGQRECEQKATRDYVGQNITIHFNSTICSHSGHCVLDGVFDITKKPWIAPDGPQQVESIIEIIKTCPSGALTYTLPGGEKITDWNLEQKIYIVENGPYYVEGFVELKDDQDSDKILISKEHYTLCRCGESKNKPFCDGSHRNIDFKG